MDAIVKADLHRIGGATGTKEFLKILFQTPGFRFLYFFRKTNSAKNTVARIFYRMMYRRYFIKYGIQINRKTRIGKGLYIGHFGGIVINVNTIIGNNCNIAHNVTIGQENRGPRKGTPILGDKVWIGTGSVIVGNINIGNNVLIAPNSYVNFDIPSDSLVIGQKIIPSKEATLGYINNCI